MRYRGWRGWLTGGILAYLCIIVTCKKHRRGETYGDLGDEILIDEPTHTNRKNEIPRRDEERDHKIETRTITKNTFGRYVNPLFYREFTSAPYRRNPRPAKPNYRGAVSRIPPWTKKHVIPPWDKKNVIHRPMPAKPRVAPRPPLARGRILPQPMRQPRRPGVVRKKWFQPKLPSPPRPRAAPRPPANAAAAAAAARAKHQVHVQVPPPRGQMGNGIHSGFVLMPARSSKPKPKPPPPAPRPPARKVPARFSEKQHIFVPMSATNVASYHIDEIGNLIPDISDPRYYEPRQAPCRVPMKRDKNCPPPSAAKSAARPARPNLPPQRKAPARNPRLPPPRAVVRPARLPPPRQAARKPPPPRPRPKSSQRILYFAQSHPQTPRFQQPQRPRPPPQARAPPARPPPKPAAQRPPPGRTIKQYEVPRVSNSVYQYINDKTAQPPNRAPMNPLLAYLQYHRTHPNQPAQPPRMDKRSIVTGLFCCLKHWNWTITADNRNNRKILQ